MHQTAPNTTPLPRYANIDSLRAISIVGVIVTHILSTHLGSNGVNLLWNYLHFVVPVFVFCSGYVTYQQYRQTNWSKVTILSWYKKRAIRLIAPYLFWTLLYVAIFHSLRLDYTWLPILFLELMLVTPLYLFLWEKYRFFLLTFLALTTLWLPPVDYRLIMWLPWSFIFCLSFLSAEKKPSTYLVVAITSFLLFFLGNNILNNQHVELTLTLHKYPPDWFYLSYGVGIGALLLALVPSKRFPVAEWVSKYSYHLFFAHYLLIPLVNGVLQRIGLPVHL